MKKLVIGMVGKAGSGKDTVADYLVEKHDFVKFALADPLKAGVKSVFMLDDKTVYDRIEREKPLKDFPDWSARKLLQFVGTELFRTHFDSDIWAKLLLKRIRESDKNKIVCSDIRFPNEYNILKDNNEVEFYSIKTVREGCIGHNIGLKNHASEMHDLDFDCLIKNNRTIEELYNEVDKIIYNILYKDIYQD